MKMHTFSLYLCLFTATACLGVGYFLAGYWQFVPVLLGTFFLSAWMKKQSVARLDATFLLVYTVLAAAGVVVGISVPLMVVTCAFALASWDLLRFEQSIGGSSTSHSGTALEKDHLRSLSVAVVTGLLFAILSSYINLQLPFIIIVSLALLTLGGLTYGVQLARKAE